jgi:hypothetical protein
MVVLMVLPPWWLVDAGFPVVVVAPQYLVDRVSTEKNVHYPDID